LWKEHQQKQQQHQPPPPQYDSNKENEKSISGEQTTTLSQLSLSFQPRFVATTTPLMMNNNTDAKYHLSNSNSNPKRNDDDGMNDNPVDQCPAILDDDNVDLSTTATTTGPIVDSSDFSRLNNNNAFSLPWPSNGSCRSQSPPPPTTTTRKVDDGPLVQQLKRIRSTIQGDIVRLASGQYPFCAVSHHNRRHSSSSSSSKKNIVIDRNDPRNRATTVIDVTILGRTIYDAEKRNRHHCNEDSQQHHLMTFPCYVHTTWTSTTTNNEPSSIPNATFTNIVLTKDTIVAHNVRYGTQLRIYNAIYIPNPMPSLINDPTNDATTNSERHYHSDPHSSSSSTCSNGYIVCTQLCEPYAITQLPALIVPPRCPDNTHTDYSK
jgi:hypothetical protein